MDRYSSGGKWTTYRQMAEETVDQCIKSAHLKPKNGCVTKGLILNGGEKWSPTSYIRLVQDYGIETEVKYSRLMLRGESLVLRSRLPFISRILMVTKLIK